LCKKKVGPILIIQIVSAKANKKTLYQKVGNCKTGEKVPIAAKKLPFFKCEKELKERVDYPAN